MFFVLASIVVFGYMMSYVGLAITGVVMTLDCRLRPRKSQSARDAIARGWAVDRDGAHLRLWAWTAAAGLVGVLTWTFFTNLVTGFGAAGTLRPTCGSR